MNVREIWRRVIQQFPNIPIRIQEPSPLRVIVPALQIVQPRVRIVVIPPIPERIERADNPLLNRCRARLGGNRAVAPCVIGVRAYLGSVFRVDGDDVPLQVLLEVVGVEYIFGITLVSVLQPDGSAVLIIEVYQEVVRGLRATTALRRPCLGDDLGAVQRVVVDRTAVCLDGSDAIHSEDSTRICFVYNSVMESSLRIFQITATSFYNAPTRYLLVRCL